jgi:biotin operon repressor
LSNHLTSLVYKLDVGSLMRKSTLVLLADKASDDGTGIWASKQTMADELCCSKQAVINTLEAFVNEGILIKEGQRDHLNGYTIMYALDLAKLEALPRVKRWAGDQSTMLTSQRGGPVKRDDSGGQRRLPKPSSTPSPPAEADASAPPQGGLPLDLNEEKPEAETPKRGSRIPDGWTPPPIETLPEPTQAVVRQWPAGAYAFVAVGFVSHWTAESGARASKKDWGKAWVKWLHGEGARVMSMARSGLRFADATAAAADPAAVAEIERLQRSENADVAALRGRLRADLGEAAYDGWLKTTAIGIDHDGIAHYVTIICRDAFICDWVRQHFFPTIRAMACKVLETADVTVHCEPVGDR